MRAFEKLEWDSNFFGVAIGRLCLSHATKDEAAKTVESAEQAGLQCLYWLIESDDRSSSAAAESCDFHLVDVQLTYEVLLPREGANPATFEEIRPFERGDLPALLAIAREGHRDSRFYYDGHFPDEKCGALYEAWIRRALERQSDRVLVAEKEGKVVGYCVCHLEQEAGRIGLIAVHPSWQGCRVGTGLVRSALAHFEQSGMRSATVVTQGRNVRSQRLYQRCGLVTKSVRLWYHRWSDAAA